MSSQEASLRPEIKTSERIKQLVIASHRADQDILPIFGSGLTCTVPTMMGIPGTKEFVELAIEELKKSECNPNDLNRVLLSREQGYDHIETYRLAVVALENCQQLSTHIRNIVLRCAPAHRNSDHLELVESLHRDWVVRPGVLALGNLLTRFGNTFPFAITTNFDPLLEVAIYKAGGSPNPVVYTLAQQVMTRLGRVPVLHAHGYWLGDTLHSNAQLEPERPILGNFLARTFSSKKLVPIVIGYGGWNDNIMRALSNLVRDAHYPLLHWCLRQTGNDANLEAERILTRLCGTEVTDPNIRKRVIFYAGIDADTLLVEIDEALAKFSIDQQTPMEWLISRISRLEEKLLELHNELKNKNQLLVTSEEKVSRLVKKLDEKDAQCREKDRTIEEKDGALKDREALVKEKDAIIKVKDQIIAKKDDAFTRKFDELNDYQKKIDVIADASTKQRIFHRLEKKFWREHKEAWIRARFVSLLLSFIFLAILLIMAFKIFIPD